jgi:hypothetical protein
MAVAGIWVRGATLLALLALLALGCGSEKSSSPGATGSSDVTESSATSVEETESDSSDTSAEGLPAPVSETRSSIVAAAESGDYGPLRALVKPDVFLSDFGFGTEPDPVGRWQEMGPEPLETMGVLLGMPHAVRETNEGTLYEWPRFDTNSKMEDLTGPERDVLLTFMTEDELINAFLPEYGYTGPSLGILANGNWWFLILEPEV